MRTTATLPRRFALLGDDEGCVPLVNAILESSDHELVAAALTGPLLAAWEQAAAPRTETPDWQDWLHDPDVEGVIIAGQTSSLQEAARQLGAAGKWVVLFPQAEMGGVFATELALDDAERPQALLPVFPARRSRRCSNCSNASGRVSWDACSTFNWNVPGSRHSPTTAFPCYLSRWSITCYCPTSTSCGPSGATTTR